VLIFSRPAVPKIVLRKYETVETHEIGEIFQYLFSATYVFSTCYGSTAGNESYLRSYSFNGLGKPAITREISVNFTGVPEGEGFGADVSDIVIVAGFTTCVTAADVLLPFSASPL